MVVLKRKDDLSRVSSSCYSSSPSSSVHRPSVCLDAEDKRAFVLDDDRSDRFDFRLFFFSLFTHHDDFIEQHERSLSRIGTRIRKISLARSNDSQDESLSELEFIETVIAYIRQLQGLLQHDSWNECLNKLASSMKSSFLSSPPSTSSPSSSHPAALFNELLLRSPRSQSNENVQTIRRSPLAIINLDNTR